MNLKQAQYVQTIVQEGSITAAAKKLFISQPSLSQMLRQAEQELGQPIFFRKTNPLQLTYAGERYLQAAEAIISACDRLDCQIRQIKAGTSGRLRLGISLHRAKQLLPSVFPWFLSQYPNVSLELVEAGSAKLEKLALQGQVDLVLAAVEATSQQLAYQLLEPEQIGIVAGRQTHLAQRFPAGTPIDIAAAMGDSFISIKQGHSIRVVQDKLFHRLNLAPVILLETESVEIGKLIALEAGACMLCSSVYVDQTVRERGGFYPLKDYENHRHFYACYPKDEVLPKYAQELLQLISRLLYEKRNLSAAGGRELHRFE